MALPVAAAPSCANALHLRQRDVPHNGVPVHPASRRQRTRQYAESGVPHSSRSAPIVLCSSINVSRFDAAMLSGLFSLSFALLLLCSSCSAFSVFGGDSASGCPMFKMASSISTRVSDMFTTAVPEQAFEGTGNNMANPTWGAINQPFTRQTPVRYADGISKVGGAALASPRAISN
jgi:hypothetical protein